MFAKSNAKKAKQKSLKPLRFQAFFSLSKNLAAGEVLLV